MRHWLLRLLVACFVIGVASQADSLARSHASGLPVGKAVLLAKREVREREPSPGGYLREEVDGRSEDRALELKLETGFRLKLPRCSGDARFVSLRPTLSTVAGRTLYHLSYKLSSSKYLLKLGGGSAAARQGREDDRYLRVAKVVDNAEPLSLSRGSRATIRLDPISYTATRKIIVKRRAFITFSVTGAPKPRQGDYPLNISIRTAEQRELEAVEASGHKDERPYASFILTPNVYFVEVKLLSSKWPRPPLAEPLRSAELTLRVDDLVYQDLPDSFQALQSWLTAVGLDKLMEVMEFFDLRNPQRGLPRSNQRLADFAAEVAFKRGQRYDSGFSEKMNNLAEQIAAGKKIDWPAGLKEADRPALVVSFRAKQGGKDFDASEEAFEKGHGVGLWDRVLQKISSLEAISARRIIVHVLLPCGRGLAYLGGDNRAYRTGGRCVPIASVSSSIPLVTTANVASAATSPWYRFKFGSAPRTLENTVPGFLKLFLSPAPAELDFLTTEPDFVEVIVRGIKGQVIRGGRDWERLQITIAVTGSGEQRTLRVTIDGRLASGLGGCPPDSQFTRDMEPQYSMNLSEYTKRLARSLRNQLSN